MHTRMIGTHYSVKRELGAGAFGKVYHATDTRTGQPVAIKQLRSEVTQPQMIERFKREGEALRDLNHPNIVKMLDTFEDTGHYYLVMEYIAGGDLTHLIAQGKVPYETIISLSIDLADALTRAHKLNIIHRDLKPANVLIGEDGVLRLTDFGVAHVGSKERVTDTDAIVGTIDYLPPEAFDGGGLDARGDIWAFGVMLFEMLTGRRPFAGTTIVEVLQAIIAAPIPDLEALCPDAPIALIDLVYRMLERDIRMRIPSARIIGSELEAIQQGRHVTPQTRRFDTDLPDYFSRPKHNLPAQTTPFVGREHELDALAKLLDDPTMRLITIIGHGGMGKTRLSLEIGQKSLSQFRDGVYFIELAPLNDASAIVNSIGDAMAYTFQEDGRTPKEQILNYLSTKNVLLIFDNFEHLVNEAGLITAILNAAPSVAILATSRQRLSQSGETLFHLSGMEFPTWETPDDALEYAAIKLFIGSALRVRPDFELTDRNLPIVARICKLVEGMPLGIVLAASWLNILSLTEIVEEIQGGLDFLETDEANLPDRQRSIRAVMDYSWQQMTEAEQTVFMKLSVFRGGFTRDAAQAVGGANLRILSSLINKSLIRRNSQTGRYEIHELLRQYADERLEQSQERAYIHDAFSQYFIDFLAECEPRIKSHQQVSVHREIDADFDNIINAWHHALASSAVELHHPAFETLSVITSTQRHINKIRDLLKHTIQHPSLIDHPARYWALIRMYAVQSESHKDSSDNLPSVEVCLEMAEAHHNHLEIIRILLTLTLGNYAHSVAIELPERLSLIEQVISLSETYGKRYDLANAYQALTYWLTFAQNNEESHRMAQQAYDISVEVGASDIIMYTASYLATINANRLGQFDVAKQYGEEALYHRQQLNPNSLHITENISFFVEFAANGELEKARKQLNFARLWWQDHNSTSGQRYSLIVLGQISAVEGKFDEADAFLQQGLLYSRKEKNSLLMYHIGMAILYVGQGNYEAAKASVVYVLNFFLTGMRLMVIAAAVCILAHEQEFERATAYLSFIKDHPVATKGWRDKWQPFINVEQMLQSALNPKMYQSAWEHGKSLDLETIVQDLLYDFGTNE